MNLQLDTAIKWLQKSNRYLGGTDVDLFDQSKIQQYMDNFTLVFLDKTKHMDRRTFQELCDLNDLYALQHKLGVDLPPYLKEIAYDFDNPDYPGFEQILEKVKAKKYKIYKIRLSQ